MRYRVILVNGRGDIGNHEINTAAEVHNLVTSAMNLGDKIVSITIIDQLIVYPG